MEVAYEFNLAVWALIGLIVAVIIWFGRRRR